LQIALRRQGHFTHSKKGMMLAPPRQAFGDLISGIASLMPGSAPALPENLTIVTGSVAPLGPSAVEGGINFAVAAPNATSVALCLFTATGEPAAELPMHRDTASGVWHGIVPNLPAKSVLYGLRVDGNGGWDGPFRWDSKRILLDPYARYVVGRSKFGVRDEFEQFEGKMGSRFLGTYDFTTQPFDWGPNYRRPSLPDEDLIIYELPVRTFTADPSSGVAPARRGTFLGLADKIPHLLSLGINAVELLPVFEYDELEFQRQPNPRDHMTNIWGYSHLNFFAPMSRFGAASQEERKSLPGSDPVATAEEFKEMVRKLHNAGIEVILDVVYNHTAEADDEDPYLLSWRGIDAKEYYQQDPNGFKRLCNMSGCGNTIAGNAPLGKELILESLRWWVTEFHVDGFRFDLASCLCRDSQGRAIEDPPLIRAIAKDPILSKVKLIAEPWDIGMYQVGTFPAYKKWAEWNGKYRDDIRKFIRGDPGMKSAFATRIAGSQDVYGPSGRKPYHSVNFVIAHDGFTLADLVSYNEKHNNANGEGNRDGTNDNFSWNCGEEGPTNSAAVNALRARQMRNLHLALMLSQGVPMVLAGDEYGQSRSGNNNWYGHDSSMTWIDWNAMESDKSGTSGGTTNPGWFRFYSEAIKFRKESLLLGRADFLSEGDVTWHETRWDDPESRFLAFTLHDRSSGSNGDLYAAFNAHSFEVAVALPSPPSGKKWCRLADTNLPSPRDWTVGGNNGVEGKYTMQSNSAILLIAKDV
jgi:isoamylase